MVKQSWNHIHGHSTFSQKDAIGKPDEIVRVAAERGFDSICITDHGTLSGWFDHWEACKKYGVKGLFGVEAYVAPENRLHKGVTKEEEKAFAEQHGRAILKEEKKAIQKYRKQAFHLVLLAQNEIGIKNLYKIISDANINGYYYFPKTDWGFLRDHSEGLIASSACGSGVLAKPFRTNQEQLLCSNLHQFYDIFGSKAFLELQLTDWEEQLNINRKMIELSRQYSMPLVITQDFHYPNKEDDFSRKYLKKIAFDQTIEDLDEWNRSAEHTMHVCTQEEARGFWNKFGYASEFGENILEEAFANTRYISSQINAEPDYITRKFPKFTPPDGFTTSIDYFNHLIAKGWEKHIPHMGKAPGNKTLEEYRNRLQYEINVIHKMGFIDYFLIVADFNVWAKYDGKIACGPARGSAGGSIVSWILSITEIDPLRWNLSFERFLNENRDKPPDIDSDLSDTGRHIVKDYISQKWGAENVVEIGAYAKFKQRLMFRDVCRVHQPKDSYEIKEYNKQVNIVGKTVDNDKSFVENIATNSQLKKFLEQHDIKNIGSVVDRLEHGIHHTTRAAAGIIISDRPVDEITSLRILNQKSSKKKFYITETEGDKLVDAGFLKMDILGITDLRILQDSGNKIDYIREYNEKAGYELAWFYEGCSFDDPNVWSAFSKGDTFACFQMGGHYITELTKKVKPNCLEELSAILALDRPQQIKLGYPEKYWKRKHGLEKVESIHPFIDDILSDTYGLLIYQESFISIINKLGLSYGEADILRRLCEDVVKPTKKDRALPKYNKLMEKLLSKDAPDGITKQEIKKIIKDIGSTVGYSFNRCISGDSKIDRGNAGRTGQSCVTIEHLYQTKNNLEYAKNNHVIPLRKKLRRLGYGKCLGLDIDGRIRPLPIKNIVYNGKKIVYELKLKNGNYVQATLDHRFLTDCGWKKLGDIDKLKDKICIDGGYEKKTYNSRSKRIKDGTHMIRGKGSSYESHRGFMKGDKNPGWVDGRSAKFKEFIKYHKDNNCPCEVCGKVFDRDFKVRQFEADHISAFKFQWLCVSCHKKIEYSRGRTVRWQKGHQKDFCEIYSIELIGEKDTYDIEMDHESHNYLANGIITHNSHSLAYTMISYFDQYMKVYHPIEFWESVLNAEITASSSKDLNQPLSYLNQSCKRFGKELINTVGTINNWSRLFQMVWDSQRQPFLYFALLNADGISNSTLDRIEEYCKKHGPFKYLHDFFDNKKLKGSKINKSHQLRLIKVGLFDNMPLCKENNIILNRMQMIEWHNKFSETKKIRIDYLLKDYITDDNIKFTKKDQSALEIEIFGLLVTHNPFGLCSDIQEKLDKVSEKTGRKAIVGAVIDADRKKYSTVLKISTGLEMKEFSILDRDFKKAIDLHVGVLYIFEFQEDDNYKIPKITKIIPYSAEKTLAIY